MFCKRFCVVVLVVIVGLSFCMQERVFSSDAYFTPRDIKEQILRAIEGSNEFIDIAVSDITARDILNALVKAHKRGVQVRMVIGKKQSLRRALLSGLNKNGDLAIKEWNQKGLMRNNFAIFDCKLLVTGSYYWSGGVGRFNYDNAIFTDEARVLVKYQREFDRLFHGGVIPKAEDMPLSGREGTPAITGEKTEGGPSLVIPEVPPAGKQVIASDYGFVISGTADGGIDMGFEDFNNIFGMASGLSDEQKEGLWSRCEGKKVKWHGRVNYIGWGLVTGWMMAAVHGDTTVEIKLNAANKAHFSHVKYGNTVTYTGKLSSRVTRVFPYKLEDGDVLEIEDTPLRTPDASELIANPYTVPVSQGPKKIFLIESFEDMDNIFGNGSNLTDAQKDEAWEKYKGKYVSWSGQIVYKNLNVASGLRIRLLQTGNRHVELKVGLAKKDKVLKFQDGETILYTGRLTERCGGQSPYMLEDGDIMTIK